jgi:hypothetical protein
VTAAVALLLPLLGSDASLLMVALLLIIVRSGTLGSTLVKTVMVAIPNASGNHPCSSGAVC